MTRFVIAMPAFSAAIVGLIAMGGQHSATIFGICLFVIVASLFALVVNGIRIGRQSAAIYDTQMAGDDVGTGPRVILSETTEVQDETPWRVG